MLGSGAFVGGPLRLTKSAVHLRNLRGKSAIASLFAAHPSHAVAGRRHRGRVSMQNALCSCHDTHVASGVDFPSLHLEGALVGTSVSSALLSVEPRQQDRGDRACAPQDGSGPSCKDQGTHPPAECGGVLPCLCARGPAGPLRARHPRCAWGRAGPLGAPYRPGTASHEARSAASQRALGVGPVFLEPPAGPGSALHRPARHPTARSGRPP